jgi:hypothetical protein
VSNVVMRSIHGTLSEDKSQVKDSWAGGVQIDVVEVVICVEVECCGSR